MKYFLVALLLGCGGGRTKAIVFANGRDLEFCRYQAATYEHVEFKTCMQNLGYEVKP